MFRCILGLVILSLAASLETPSTLLADVLIKKDINSCEDVCEHTYTLHTYPKAEHLSCCKRGCRFYSMIDVLGTDDNANITHRTCSISCGDAYKNPPEKLACVAGCDSQQSFASKRPPQQAPPTSHVLQPLMYVHTVYSNMVGHVSRFISSSWTFYIQEDDGKLIVSKDTPDIMRDFVQEDGGDSHDTEDFGNSLKDFSGATLRRDEFIEVQESLDDPRGRGPSERGVDWLSCVSRQSGVPRRLLLLFLLLAIMVMVWLCCATAATAQEQRVKNLRVNNDLSYLLLCNASEKVKIQPRDVTKGEEEEDDVPLLDADPLLLLDLSQAPPLPSKTTPPAV